MSIRSIIVAALFAAVSIPAAAEAPKQLQSDAIRTQQAEIRRSAEAGEGRYRSLTSGDRRQLFTHQDRVDALLGDTTLTTELSEVHQVELFNNLEAISALVNDEADERLICRRIKPVGSNRPTTVCRTAAQLREEKELSDRAQMRRSL